MPRKPDDYLYLDLDLYNLSNSSLEFVNLTPINVCIPGGLDTQITLPSTSMGSPVARFIFIVILELVGNPFSAEMDIPSGERLREYPSCIDVSSTNFNFSLMSILGYALLSFFDTTYLSYLN